MAKINYSSLVFVSQSKNKYCEYCHILGICDLKQSTISMVEPQSLNIYILVQEKIDYIKMKLPPDVPFFVEHTGLMIDAWKGLPGGLTNVFMETVGKERNHASFR